MPRVPAFLCLFTLTCALGQARPVDLQAPSGTLGSSDAMGFVETWEEVQDIDFGGGLTLPFRFGFTSRPDRTSTVFGKGWIVPLLDSRAVQIDETTIEAELPCGKVLYLHRKMEDAVHFHTQDGGWQGLLDPSTNTFSVTRDDGWLIKYEQGHLAELKTDQGRDIIWKYNGDQFVSLDEVGGTSGLTLTRGVTGQANGFVVNGNKYGFTMDRRPMVQDGPKGRVIAELDPSLSSFQWPNGKSDMFKFSVAGDLTPALTMTDAVGQKDNYTWQPNGYILSDNDWKYRIGPQIANSNLPSLSRTNTQGQTESISIATRTGTIIETNLQGVITTTKVFRTPGPYFNKVREITQTSNGVTQVLERRSYDQAGRLIRSMDQSGTVTTYTYDSAGKLARQANSVDPQVFAELQKEEAAMLKAIAATTDVGQKNALLENLGLFYVHQMKDDKKASALVAAITDPFAAYTLRTHAIAYDGDLTSQQKITEYQKLLAQYPNQRAFTDSLIAIAQDHPTGE